MAERKMLTLEGVRGGVNGGVGPGRNEVEFPRVLTHLQELDDFTLGDLSDFFNPFLRHFMGEALRCGGDVQFSAFGREVTGIFLYHDVENEASIFTRDRELAERFHAARERVPVFSDFELEPRSEVYHIYAADHPGWPDGHRFSHPVRVARPDDRPAAIELLREVYGRVDERWVASFPPGREECFVVDGSDELAGVGWASVINGEGRLHSLSVRPRYRRTGVGRDLFYARMGWTRRAEAIRVISEISEHNIASRAIAETGGMRAVGKIYRSVRT
jgi:GNAT superfamily N-acetyltransferase